MKSRLAKIMCSPIVGRLLSHILRDLIPNRGCVIDTKSEVIAPEIKASLFWGIYESAEVRFVKRYLRPDLDVIELGSSIGVVTSHIASKIDPSCRLICVEANPNLLEQIQVNVARNAPLIRTSVIHGALDYNNRTVVNFFITSRNTDSRIRADINGQSSIQIPTITLSEILVEQQISDYTLVSDIEGSEVGILENDEGALVNCRQLIIELHEAVYQEHHVTVDMMCQTLQSKFGFILRDQYGAVCVFEK